MGRATVSTQQPVGSAPASTPAALDEPAIAAYLDAGAWSRRVFASGSLIGGRTETELLLALANTGELTPSELADRLALDTGQVSHALRTLEHDKQLVASRPHPADGRRVIYQATALGHRAVQQFHQQVGLQAAVDEGFAALLTLPARGPHSLLAPAAVRVVLPPDWQRKSGTKTKLGFWRSRSGWSQRQLATVLGFSPSTVSDWERAVTEPTARQLRACGLALGVPLSQLIDD